MKNLIYIIACSLSLMTIQAQEAESTSNLSNSSSFAQSIEPDYFLHDGGCHYVIDVDTLTGERTMLPASKARRKGHYASTADGLGAYGTSGVGPVNTIGDITIPVIMVDFSDQAFLPTTTEAAVEQWFNGENYTGYGNTGSVRDYFITQSGGMFRPYFKVMGIVHTGKTVATYGAGNSNQENVEGLAHDVTGKFGYNGMTRQSGLINYVPLCIIYYAGGGQHRTGNENQIWAKFTEYSYYDFTGIFSQYFKSYLYINEARGNEMDGVGTACHEISHALGLPDIYDTSGGGCRTPGLWSVMANGNYAASGYSPVDMCALERSQCGWLQMKELNTAGSYTLAPTEAAFIRNSSNNKEYYILENRTNTRWTPPGMSGGMLVYHIDYDKSAWENSKVNVDDSHPRMMFVAADRSQKDAYESDYHNDLYPYQKNDSLTVKSNPTMTAYSGNFNGKPVYNIRRVGSNISFDYIVKTEVPEITPPDKQNIEEVIHPKRTLGTTPLSSLSEVKEGQLYALYNPHFKAYAIYAPKYSKAYVWTAGTKGDSSHSVAKSSYSKTFNVTSSFSAWRVAGQQNRYTFQNEGSEFYLSTPMTSGSNPCAWVVEQTGMITKERSDGLFAMSSSGGTYDYCCVAPQLTTSPISVWANNDDGTGWQLIPIYDEEEPVVPETKEQYILGTPLNDTSTISESAEYALYCPHYKGYAIVDETHSITNVWTAELTGDASHVLNSQGGFDGPYNASNPYHRWKFSRSTDSKWLIQNVGTKTYLRTAGSNNNGSSGATTVSTQVEGLIVTGTSNGTFVINRTNQEMDFMCASPQLDYPVSNWTANDAGSQWQIIPVEYLGGTTDINSITEAPRNVEPEFYYDLQGRRAQPLRGIYINNRRKVLISVH